MTLIAHLPGYRLAAGASTPYGPGRLTHLTWEEWRRIDSDYPFEERRYGNVRPLFFVVEDAAAEPDLDAFLAGTATLAHLALTMRNPGTDRTPGPRMSVGYHDHGSAQSRLVGPLERESIVWGYGAPTDLAPLQVADIDAAQFLLGLLGATREAGSVRLLLDVMESTARPDIHGTTAFVLCIAALEFVLLPDECEGLRAAFGRRLATLCASNSAERAQLQSYAADVYRLRSDVVHGRIRETSLALLGLRSPAHVGAELGRNLVRPVLINVAGAIAAGVDPEELPQRLDAARTEPEWDQLRQLLFDGMSRHG